LDKKQIISKLNDAISNNKGDNGRNQYLIKRINENHPLFESDKKYLEKILEEDIIEIKNKPIAKNNKPIFLNPNLTKCLLCNIDIQLDEKSTRYKKNGIMHTV